MKHTYSNSFFITQASLHAANEKKRWTKKNVNACAAKSFSVSFFSRKLHEVFAVAGLLTSLFYRPAFPSA
jgi:hypothetical protein